MGGGTMRVCNYFNNLHSFRFYGKMIEASVLDIHNSEFCIGSSRTHIVARDYYPQYPNSGEQLTGILFKSAIYDNTRVYPIKPWIYITYNERKYYYIGLYTSYGAEHVLYLGSEITNEIPKREDPSRRYALAEIRM